MKREINKVAYRNDSLDELTFFREMSKSLNKNAAAVYVRETHGNRGLVKFPSKYYGTEKQREISDLMIISINTSTSKIKLSFLQAKYHRTRTTPFLKFYGDYLQLELLSDRPDIDPNNSFGFPQNILNFSNFRSLTTYGVFYHDKIGQIDMLFSVADLLKPIGSSTKGPIIFPGHPYCPRLNCFTSNSNEMLSTCNIDLFEKGLVSFQIGAPIIRNSNIDSSIKALFMNLIPNSDKTTSDFLESILDYFGTESLNDRYQPPRGNPNMLILKTNNEIIGNSKFIKK